MFKKLILATAVLTIVSPIAFADKKKPVPPPKPPIETIKGLEAQDKMGNFETQTATAEQ